MVAMARFGSKSLSARATRWRALVQTGFLAVWLTPFLKLHNVCGPVFHCYACPLSTFACPIGVLANFSAIHVIPLLAIGTLVAMGAAVGSFVCGWACPFGFLQDILARIPTPRFALPRWSGVTRYAVLAGLVIAIPFVYGESHPLFICRVCPAGALEGAYVGMAQAAIAKQAVVWPSIAKTVIFLVILSAMLFANRPWCGLFCPLGAIYGLFNRVSALYVKVDADGCIKCGACIRKCRYSIIPLEQSRDTRCIRCLECTDCESINAANAFSTVKEASPESTKL
jgi:ferredoxin-type protein NapH